MVDLTVVFFLFDELSFVTKQDQQLSPLTEANLITTKTQVTAMLTSCTFVVSTS